MRCSGDLVMDRRLVAMLKIGKQGKIKGRGTMPRQNVGLHKGWRGTRFESRSADSDTACSLITNRTSMSYANVVSTSLELSR